jgi:NDP-sugar pyrophosphorylase family protein
MVVLFGGTELQAVILDPGTVNTPKGRGSSLPGAFVDIGGRPLIEHQLDFLFTGGVESACVCTGEKGYNAFRDWLRSCDYTGRVELVTNSSHNGDSIGPLNDLGMILERGNFTDGVVVTAGNRYFDFPFEGFVRSCGEHDGDVVVVMDVRNGGKAVRCGMAAVTANERIISFTVDPEGKTRTPLVALPLLHLSAETIPYLGRYLSEGNDTGCIGSFLEWSYRFRPLFAYKAEGKHFCITNGASAKKVASHFEKTGRI